jgi:hypothetical protein
VDLATNPRSYGTQEDDLWYGLHIAWLEEGRETSLKIWKLRSQVLGNRDTFRSGWSLSNQNRMEDWRKAQVCHLLNRTRVTMVIVAYIHRLTLNKSHTYMSFFCIKQCICGKALGKRQYTWVAAWCDGITLCCRVWHYLLQFLTLFAVGFHDSILDYVMWW